MSAPERDEIFARVRDALRDVKPMPLDDSMRIASRMAGDAKTEIELCLSEIAKLGGTTRVIHSTDELANAFAELVRAENIRVATTWDTDELRAARDLLARLGVMLVACNASSRELANCDLGVTGADAILPESGTLVLKSTPTQSPFTSLLPRVHLALVRANALHADLHSVLKEIKHDQRVVFITGPSRTADIEKVLTIGVHGPKALYVWVLEI